MNKKEMLWVEDDIPRLHMYLTEFSSRDNPIQDILKKYSITFAYDLEMAITLLNQRQFELHVLDGDFPSFMPNYEKEKLDGYIKKHFMNADIPIDRRAWWVGNREEVLLFRKLYRDYMKDKVSGPTVLFSANYDAPEHGHFYEIPTFTKSEENSNSVREKVRDSIEEDMYPYSADLHIEKHKKKVLKELNQWKCGGVDDFLNYILS